MHFYLSVKKVIFLIFLLFIGSFVNAQNEEHPAKKILDPKDRIVVDFNFDSWQNIPKGINQKPYSFGGNIYFIWDYPIGFGPVSLAFGGGFSTHDVHTNGKIVYSTDGRYTSFVPITTKYNTNKLSCNYFEIPVELRIRSRNNHSFKLALGGKIGYAFNVHTKYEDHEGKIKVYKIKNIDPIRYGLTARVGYDRFNIQAFYSLSPLFLKGRGEPNMIPFSIGIGLLLY